MLLKSIAQKTFISLSFVFASLASFAQNAQTEFEIIQDAFGLDKKAAVANFMELGEDANAFWTLYDAYEAERKKLGKQRIQVIAQYAQSYPSISEEELMELYQRTEKIKKSFAKLQDTYFKKMKKEVGVSKAVQFWQLESYFSAMIQARIYNELPFIGEE